MKYLLSLLLTITSVICFTQVRKNTILKKEYAIMSLTKKGGNSAYYIDKQTINKLPEPLKAIVAYYSVVYSTNCVTIGNNQTCELTEALGLGNQGSPQQKRLLNKWFMNDLIITEMVHERNCRVLEPGSSFFIELLTLKLYLAGDTVQTNYKIAKYDHGLVNLITRSEFAVIKNGNIIFIHK